MGPGRVGHRLRQAVWGGLPGELCVWLWLWLRFCACVSCFAACLSSLSWPAKEATRRLEVTRSLSLFLPSPGQDKNAKKVFERLQDDFGAGRKERVIRLDPPSRTSAAAAAAALAVAFPRAGGSGAGPDLPGSGVGAGAAGLLPAAGGLEDLDVALRDCVRISFKARQAAYMEEVRERRGCFGVGMRGLRRRWKVERGRVYLWE